ncbi:MAG: outer membrane lipoprotein chaperone LolA [Halothiobacillus sp.]
MMRWLIGCVFVVAPLSLSVIAPALADTQAFPLGTPAAATPTDVRPLTEFVKNLKTFSANFIQKQVNVRGQTQPGSTGNFVLARPGQFYWAYEVPYVQKLIASDGKLWVYDPDLAQVTISSLSDNRGAPIGIFLGNQPLEEVFTIRSLGNNDGLSWYALSDRSQKSDFSSVQIGMDAKGIKAMVFKDKLGNNTTVQFSAREVNQPVDKTLFAFTPPAGVDVVNSH